MSLILMEGFETRKTFQDWQSRPNWLWNSSLAQPLPVFPTTRAPETGRGFNPVGTLQSYGNYPSNGNGSSAWAYNPNLTVNQAWLNGGMTMGFSGRMTSSVVQNIGTTYYNSGSNLCINNSMCFDGTYYYALQQGGSTTLGVVRSKDLIHWTLTSSQPTTVTQYMSIAYVNGAVAVIGTTSASTCIVYYSTDQGNNWKSYALGPTGVVASIFNVIATGNPTYPVLIFGSYGGPFYIFVGNWTTGFTQVLTQASIGPYYFANRPRIVGNTILCPCNNTQGGNSVVYTANVSSNLSASASWTATNIPIQCPSDWAYNPNTKLWNIANYQGIWMIPAAGTPAAPTFPAAVDCALTGAQTGVSNLVWNGSRMIGTGLNGMQCYSIDSRNFYQFENRQIFPEGTTTHWTSCFYDGSQYVLTTDNSTTAAMVVTTPDLVNDYQVMFVSDAGPSVNNGSNWAQAGFYASNGPVTDNTAIWPAATGMWHTPVTGFNLYSLTTNASGQLQLTLVTHMATDGALTTNINTVVLVNSDTNYFELQMVPAATSNTFMFYLYVNGALVAQSQSPLAMATAGNTTAQLYCFPTVCNGTITEIDDLYITLNDGKGVSGRLGPCSVIARRPTADVQAVFGRVGNQPTNSLTINQSSAKSRSGNYLTSTQTNQADVYTSSDPIQARSTVRAVQLEAGVSRLTPQSASAIVGLISANTQVEHDSAVTPIAAPVGNVVPVVSTFQTDPDGNNWTLANTLAANLTINHTN